MKHVLATTACLFTVMAVCARVANVENQAFSETANPIVQASDSSIALGQIDRLPSLAYGTAGAGLFACIIAARRRAEPT